MNTVNKIVFVKQALELYSRKTIQLVDTQYNIAEHEPAHLAVFPTSL